MTQDARVQDFVASFEALRAEVEKVIVGHREIINHVLIGMFAGGHVLLEGVPGLGKTLLIKTLAEGLELSFSRIQFTPDLMPADIIGTNIIVEDADGRKHFQFQQGPIFAHILLADEINRATPKTQSALLEGMQEAAVTVGGVSRPLPGPFFVLATQNPIEMEGTYPLPEAQRDRFMARISLGYPSARAEVAMLDTHGQSSPLETLSPVTDAATVTAMVRAVRSVFTSDAIKQYVVDLAAATRASSALRLGASPRATLHMLRASRAHAALDGRDHVLPDDVQAVVVPVLAHRMIPTGETQLARRSTAEVLQDLMRRVPVPAAGR